MRILAVGLGSQPTSSFVYRHHLLLEPLEMMRVGFVEEILS